MRLWPGHGLSDPSHLSVPLCGPEQPSTELLILGFLMEVDKPESLLPEEALVGTFDHSISSCCSLNQVPLPGGEGNGGWTWGSNRNGESEWLETDQAGTEMSLVGRC